MEQPNSQELLQQHRDTEEDKLESCSDELLISRIKGGDTDLYEILIRRYNQRLFRIIRGYLKNEHDVKDVMQSTYLKAFENLDQFREEARFSTWLIRIGINEALKKLKDRNHGAGWNAVTSPDKANLTNGIETDNPEKKAIQHDMNKYLEQAIDTLPHKYRSVLIMRELEQMSTRETARSLEITRVNVKVRLHRAKKMLRDALTDMLDEIDLLSFKGKRCDSMTRRVMNLIKHR